MLQYKSGPTTEELATCESTNLEVTIENGVLRIVSAYCSTRRWLSPDDLYKLMGRGVQILIEADLNCKHPAWNSVVLKENGRVLDKYVNKNDVQMTRREKYTHSASNWLTECSSPSTAAWKKNLKPDQRKREAKPEEDCIPPLENGRRVKDYPTDMAPLLAVLGRRRATG